MRAPEKVNLEEKFGKFDAVYTPKIVGEVDDFHVKLVKVRGPFTWHTHEAEDEMFLVTKGRMTVRLRDRDFPLEAGEFLVVPKGVEHTVEAAEVAEVVLFERAGTVNTGEVRDERTVADPERI